MNAKPASLTEKIGSWATIFIFFCGLVYQSGRITERIDALTESVRILQMEVRALATDRAMRRTSNEK